MKIRYLQISNVLSFPYFDDVGDCEKLVLDDGMNIIIGENGSGKSTALEVINFLFKRVLYRQFNFNQDLFQRRQTLDIDNRRQVISPTNSMSINEFRLEANWSSPDKPQKIRISIILDEVDRQNIQNLREHTRQITTTISDYSTHQVDDDGHSSNGYIIDVDLNRRTNRFSDDIYNGQKDFGYKYISEYNFFKESISIYNILNPTSRIP